MKAVAQFKGSPKSVGRAPRTLQWLVKLAEAGKIVEYGKLACFLGVHHRAVAHILSVIGYALQEPDLGLGKIPPIQLLVVNKGTQIPGDLGLSWVMPDDEQRAKLSWEARRALSQATRENIFNWKRWRELLTKFGLEPLTFELLPLPHVIEGIEAQRHDGGEGKDHLRLKQYLASHPSIVGLPQLSAPGQQEVLLPSGDRMDVFFESPEGWVCAEVKGSQSDEVDIIRGVFQCVKYRAVLEAKRHYLKMEMLPTVRVVLVLAGKLSDGVKVLSAAVLGIEVFSEVVVPDHFTASV